MPIVGLTDRTDLARFNRLGKIRKGGEKGESGFGEDLSYFRFVAEGGPEREGILTRAWARCYGAQPASLFVTMPYATVNECFPCWQEQWSASAMLHRCDGVTMVMWLKDDKRSYSRDPKPCPYASGAKPRTKQDPGCKAQGRLEVFLPQLLTETKFAPAIVTLETSSLHDIASITGVLLKTLAECGGDLTGQGFTVYRAQKQISTPGEAGKRVRRAKWLVKIDPAPRGGTIEAVDYEEHGLPAPDSPPEEEDHAVVTLPPSMPIPARTVQMPKRKAKAPPAPVKKVGSLRKGSGTAQAVAQDAPQPVAEPERPKTPTPAAPPPEPSPETPPEPPEPFPQVDTSQEAVPLEFRVLGHQAILFGSPCKTAGVTGETLTELVKVCTLYDKTFGKDAAKAALQDLFKGMVSRRYLTEPEGRQYLRHVSEALEAHMNGPGA